MAERNQPVKTRVKAANLIGLFAKYNSLGSKETFKRFFVGDQDQRSRIVSAICQDMHWEVRKEMCSVLINISKYLGSEDAETFIMPDLVYLLDDHEGEVTSEAIYQF